MAEKRQQRPALIAAPDTAPDPEILRRPQRPASPASAGKPGPAGLCAAGSSRYERSESRTARQPIECARWLAAFVVRVGLLRKGAA